MKPLKENSGILPTKALPFSLINKIKISPQLSNTLDILNQNVYKVWTKIADKKNFTNQLFVFAPLPPPSLQDQYSTSFNNLTLKFQNIAK